MTKHIFLWYGENSFDLQQTLLAWINAFEKKYGNVNVVRLDAADSSRKDALVADLKNGLQVTSLFSTSKLIVVRDLLTEKKNDAINDVLLQVLPKLNESFFVIIWQNSKPDGRSAVFKLLQKLEKEGVAEIKEFMVPDSRQLTQWILQRAKQVGGTIEPPAVELMQALVGANLWQLDSELRKLVSYKGGQSVTRTDVQQLVKARFNDDIFQLMDAIGNKRKDVAIQLMHDQIDSGASDMYLWAMLVRQFRLVWQVKELYEKERVTNQQDLARQLKMHPYVVQKTIGQIGKFSFEELKKIYCKLIESEYVLKTQNTPFLVVFDTLIAGM